MKSILRTIILGTLFIVGVAAPVMVTISPQPVAAACESRLMGIPPWYRGLTAPDTSTNPPSCKMKSPADVGGISNYIWRIVLNGIEMAIVAVAYVSTFFILYGGFLFMTGGSSPGQIERGRKTILNAVIGLVICMASIGVTNLIFSIIT